jgi:hypothetical protein
MHPVRIKTAALGKATMNNSNKGLRKSALVMKILGWALIAGLTGSLFLYPPGFLWGSHPATLPNIGPAHPESPLPALHPYLFMILSIYVAYMGFC